jgi:hypothetical protein
LLWGHWRLWARLQNYFFLLCSDRRWTSYAFFLRPGLPHCMMMACSPMLPDCLYVAGLCHWLAPTSLACLPHCHHNCSHHIFVIVIHPLFKRNFYFSLLCDWIFSFIYK